MENQPLLDGPEVSTSGNKKALTVAGVLAAGALFGGAVYHQTSLNAEVTSLDTVTSDKVSVYIIAEAFCPNCKEHSYLLDTLIMDKGEDMRNIIDLKLDMMVYDGWDVAADKGVCEKGAWDCEYAKYQMAIQDMYGDDESLKWWDFSRCLYKSQNKMIAKYVEEDSTNAKVMEKVVMACAEDSSFSGSDIIEVVKTKGTYLLHNSYDRTLEYDMPVWIYVNGNYIEYEDDWVNAVCAAYSGDSIPTYCNTVTSLEGGHVSMDSTKLFIENGKVDVYIVAEAFCPNCKEHSYYFDKLVMSPEGVKSGVRQHMNLYLEQMVIDGWNDATNEGMCEKGKFDCELSKYHLCVQKVNKNSDDEEAITSIKWWDYSRCLYSHQTEMIDYYYYDGGESPALMHEITSNCASETGIHADEVDTCVAEEGTKLLKASYERIGSMNDPVWIYVEGQRIDYHEDWLAVVCAAMSGKGLHADECNAYADV